MSNLSQFFGTAVGAVGGGSPANMKYQVFTSSGTFTPSAALLAAGGVVNVLLVGGGGGAGGYHSTFNAAGGGGGTVPGAGGSGYCRVEWIE